MDNRIVTTNPKDDVELKVLSSQEGETEPLYQNENKKQLDNENKPEIPISIMEKLKRMASVITVEPFLAFYVIGYWITIMATSNLNLDKACRVNLNYTDHICDALQLSEIKNFTNEELETQKLLAGMLAWKSILLTVIPVCLIMFIGAWSDKYQKRKMLILAPFAGDFLMNIGMLLNTFFFKELPMEVAGVTEIIFIAITGGIYTMNLGAYSYVSAITSLETRTFRLGLVSLAFTMCQPVGFALSGVLLKLMGYYGVFSLAACLNVVTFVYGYYTIKEPAATVQVDEIKGCCDFLRSFFDFKQLKQTLAIVFRRGHNHRLLRVILMIACITLLRGIFHGEMVMMYLFTRYRFNWNPVQFSMYTTYDIVVHFFGTIFAISVFSRYLNWDDSVIGIIAVLSKMCSTVVYIFATDSWMMYAAPVLEIFRGASIVVIKSISSKLVSIEDIGKMYAVCGLVEAAVPMIFDPLFAHFYIITVRVVPGAIFALGSAMSIPVICFFLLLYHFQRRDPKEAGPRSRKYTD